MLKQVQHDNNNINYVMVKKNIKVQISDKSRINYPPVVAVLGHVDHGKTTLLDAIRKTDIASREHGGITQRIGASTVSGITFIDTPGHEAFSKMRGRGVSAADIGLLIVSLVDGVMPQTKESISILKESKVPFIVVLTKADLQDKQPEKVKQQLLKEEVMLENYGGDVPFIEISAKTNQNIEELLELIHLVWQLNPPSSKLQNPLEGIVIESRMDTKSGPRATVVIKDGTLSLRDEIVCGHITCRVRTILNDKGERLEKAGVGEAVEVLGFEKVPEVGGIVTKKGEAGRLPHAANGHTPSSGVAPKPWKSGTAASLAPLDFFKKEEEKADVSLVLCADNKGSLEAIMLSLPKDAHVTLAKTGEISPADVLLAKSVGAILLGFNAKISPQVANLARQEKVLMKNYTIIYELLDEVADVLEGKQLALVEEIFGRAKVLASFPYEKTRVLGVKVMEGRIAKGDKVRLVRKDEIIGESTITSVRQGKNSISKVEKGLEAGIIISPLLDFTIGDMLICHG